MFSLLVLSDISLIRFHREPAEPVIETQPDTALVDTLNDITMPEAPVRLSPSELRESQPREQKQHIRRETPVDPSLLRPGQRQQFRRR